MVHVTERNKPMPQLNNINQAVCFVLQIKFNEIKDRYEKVRDPIAVIEESTR